MVEKLPGNFPPDSMTGDNTLPKNLKEIPKNEWLRVDKTRKRPSLYDDTYEITFVSENGQHHLVWATPSMMKRIKEYEKVQENGQHVYIKYIGLTEPPYSRHSFDSILY